MPKDNFALVLTIVAIVSILFLVVTLFILQSYDVMPSEDYCKKLSGDSQETIISAQMHYCDYDCTRTSCPDYGYHLNLTKAAKVINQR